MRSHQGIGLEERGRAGLENGGEALLWFFLTTKSLYGSGICAVCNLVLVEARCALGVRLASSAQPQEIRR